MPPRKKSETLPAELKTADYRHTAEKRTNIPPARIAGEGTVPQVPKARYAYSPHLTPTLQFDPTGEPDKLAELAEAATKRTLTKEEAARLQAGLRVLDPTLEWAGKREQREKGFLEVDPVALHIHERVSARAIVRAALREDVQRDLFADPQQPYQEAVQFYRHDVDWANRLILGDSLQVMSSLARRENLAGKVQMIYMDPPYGINYKSNFQSEIGGKDVKDRDEDLTRESETVKAYRDTWVHGTHSYLTYIRDRLIAAHELLSNRGSVFVQISQANLHRVRLLLDEVFGPENFVTVICFQKTSGQSSNYLSAVYDYLLWYARDKSLMKYHPLYVEKVAGEDGAAEYHFLELTNGSVRRATEEEMSGTTAVPMGARLFGTYSLFSAGESKDGPRVFDFEIDGRMIRVPCPRGYHFKTGPSGLRRWAMANRVVPREGQRILKKYIDDFAYSALTNYWSDTRGEPGMLYAAQTSTKVVQRCMLMTTDPCDLVLDPTNGSGTTAWTAEYWGRRWVGIDTSRVAVAIARQRLLASAFPYFELRGGERADPSSGFICAEAPSVEFRAIAHNQDIEGIYARFEEKLSAALNRCNEALDAVSSDLRAALRRKLLAKQRAEGKRAITDADLRRWELPTEAFEHWNVPFDADPEWPVDLSTAVEEYRAVWMQRLNEINACIAAGGESVALVDRPRSRAGVVRVSGPFTVEGVRPEELNLGDEGLFDSSPNEFEPEENALAAAARQQNLQSYLERMVHFIRQDGLTFINNQRRKFSHVEPLFDAGTGAMLHAEGAWEGEPADSYDVAVGFGPQYGPVTALQVEELLRASKRHRELVIAGFSFDADATSLIQQYSSPKLRIHQAYIRPDVNPGMDGLLKDTPNSQLFTVFGSPEIEVRKDEEGDWVVELKGVDIYDPVRNEVRSTGAAKVAAWFLDSDFDGRCFATTQAFFPDQDAWEKIAKALGSSADADAFEAFKGTVSVPFSAGTHKRVAVKVIDPRGNEVMAVRALEG